jgi:hypothetical protein
MILYILLIYRSTCIVVLESVLKNFNCNESEVAESVKRFLKYAPDRKGGERSKAKKKED